MKMLDWNDTLLDYLHSSNEDERVVRFVCDELFPHLAKIGGNINWLEVGPGPGTKTLPIAHGLREVAGERLRSLRMLEPSAAWQRFLRKNNPTLVQLGTLTEESFESHAGSASQHDAVFRPNFITCFHVLYESMLAEKFAVFLKSLASTGGAVLACVIVESEHSDFFRMRQLLQPLSGVRPTSAVVQLRTSLRKLGLKMKEVEVNSQHCQMSEDRETPAWLLPFLLGCQKDQVRSLPPQIRAQGLETIRRFILEKGRLELDVPDTAFIITTT